MSSAARRVPWLPDKILFPRNQEIPCLDDLVRAKRPQRLPVVLTRDEVKRILDELSGTNWLMAALLYGAGLRLLECLQFRIKDPDIGYHQIIVRNAKGVRPPLRGIYGPAD